MSSTSEHQEIRCGTMAPSPLGPLTLYAQEGAIVSLQFGDAGLRDESPLLREGRDQLSAFFSSKLQRFDLPLRLEGSPFQNRVWAALQEIPYGATISYRDLAERVGSPRGYRAVGGANGKNPLPILIPFHRVISHDGSLGGYSGGLGIKRFLLDLEQKAREKGSP